MVNTIKEVYKMIENTDIESSIIEIENLDSFIQQNLEEPEKTQRGEMGATAGGMAGSYAGGYAGAAVGGYFGGPVGAAIGETVGQKVGKTIGEKIGSQVEDKIGSQMGDSLGNIGNSMSNMDSSQISSMAQGDFSGIGASAAKDTIMQNIPQDGIYGDVANSAMNNMEIGPDGVSFNYEGMAMDALASNKYTKGIADALNSPAGQCAIGAAKVYAGFYSGNPQMMYEGAMQIYDNYEGAIDQVKNSKIGKAAAEGCEKFCDGLKKLGDGCKKSCDKLSDLAKDATDELKKKCSGGGCSGGSCSSSSCSDSDADAKEPHKKYEIEENNVPEGWWDKLPDFDPRVFDAIMIEQAAACVDFIFEGLPDMHELEHQMEARKFRKTCPRLKVPVPRTKVLKPKEIKYDTKIG